jgi:hypothetical protein
VLNAASRVKRDAGSKRIQNVRALPQKKESGAKPD